MTVYKNRCQFAMQETFVFQANVTDSEQGRLSKYVATLMGLVNVQGRPKEFDAPAALPPRRKHMIPFE